MTDKIIHSYDGLTCYERPNNTYYIVFENLIAECKDYDDVCKIYKDYVNFMEDQDE